MTRIRVFVDYWNFQLALNKREGVLQNDPDYRFKVNWRDLGLWLVKKACEAAKPPDAPCRGRVVPA